MANDEVLYLRLPAALKLELEQEAAARMMSVSALARILLADMMERIHEEEA